MELHNTTAFVDLFCGAGGASQGAVCVPGVTLALAVDTNDAALAVYQRNFVPRFPSLVVACKALGPDAEPWLEAHVHRLCRSHPHVHIHGSPPCQGFSQARRTNRHPSRDAHRNKLTTWFLRWVIRLVARVHAKHRGAVTMTWSYENVTGPKPEAEVAAACAACRVLPWRMYHLNAVHFGAATHRLRLFAGQGWFTDDEHLKRRFLHTAPVSILQALTANGALRAEEEAMDAPKGDMARRPNNWAWATMKTTVSKYDKQGRHVGNQVIDRGSGKGLIPITEYFNCLLTHHPPRWWRFHASSHKWTVGKYANAETVAAVQGFPPGYFEGVRPYPATRLIANSVAPPVMTAIMHSAVAETQQRG